MNKQHGSGSLKQPGLLGEFQQTKSPDQTWHGYAMEKLADAIAAVLILPSSDVRESVLLALADARSDLLTYRVPERDSVELAFDRDEEFHRENSRG